MTKWLEHVSVSISSTLGLGRRNGPVGLPVAPWDPEMTVHSDRQTTSHKAVWGPKRALAVVALGVFGFAPAAMAAAKPGLVPAIKADKASKPAAKASKLDRELTRRKDANPQQLTSVIVMLVPGTELPAEFKSFARGKRLRIINGQVLTLPNRVLRQLEAHPGIFRVHHDRPIGKENYRTAVTVGAKAVGHTLGYTGAGVGVAVIDSGVSTWHDDLTDGSGTGSYPYGNQRVAAFVDFVNGQTQPYDDNGHGTHVSGIIAGNGYDSRGEKSGIAPDASLVSLKVLDSNGRGTISSIISALEWVHANHARYRVRVVNMSVGARITESYWTDPLTLAVKEVVDLGIVVVAASGNFGKNAAGDLQYGGITAPANAPWVLTVGASSTRGTLTRNDDEMASYSSAGPTFIDFSAKPDLVAPGTGTVSLAAAGSTFSVTKAEYLVDGKPILGYKPYLTLSGTSMAAPVVSGSVALMLQANPNLTPNLIKAILQYTAQSYPGYNALRQGAGFLNSLGAVRLAKFYANNEVGSRMPAGKVWSKQIIWGNHRISGGYLNPRGNAWSTQVIWGAARGLNGTDNIIWGTMCGLGCDNIIWGTNDASGDNIIWGTDFLEDNIIWGTEFLGDNIIWGTGDDDNIVWGTDCGGADCDNIIWGTSDLDNIIWGTAEPLDNIVWGTNDLDNIIWGTAAESDVTWGSSSDGEVLFPEEDVSEPLPDLALEFGEAVMVDITEPTAESSDVVITEPVDATSPSTSFDPVVDSTSATVGGL